MSFDRVAVIGAGTMGHGIAQVAAAAGCAVALHDIDPDRLDAALALVRRHLERGPEKGGVRRSEVAAVLARIRATSELPDAARAAELVIEAVPEAMDLKRSLFAELDRLAPPGAVLATNTSALSIARIAAAASDPGRVIGMHFFNPVHRMELLELVTHGSLRGGVLDRVRAFASRLGKQAIVVRDSPGFATSRLGVLLGMEAIRMVEQGVASPEDIDRAMVLGYRHPVGPLRLTDIVGLDVRMHIGAALARELGSPAFEPPALLRRMVAEGRLGRKTGRGFYRWTG